MSKSWTTKEELIVKQLYKKYGARKVQDLLPHRTICSINLRAHYLGVANEKQKWTPEEDKKLKLLFSNTDNKSICKHFPNRTELSINRRAYRLGLSKHSE